MLSSRTPIKWVGTILGIVLVIVLLVACGDSKPTTVSNALPTSTSTVEPTSTPVPATSTPVPATNTPAVVKTSVPTLAPTSTSIFKRTLGAGAANGQATKAPVRTTPTPKKPTATPTPTVSGVQHYKEVMDIAVGTKNEPSDIDTFWRNEFPKVFPGSSIRYTSPVGFFPYEPSKPPKVKCVSGNSAEGLENNAFYCRLDQTISWHESFLYGAYQKIGDMAPVVTIAHEWGHHIQQISGTQTDLTIQLELEADCFAGMYTQYAEETGKLEPGDVDEAKFAFFTFGDDTSSEWFSSQAHGQPQERERAFLLGYQGTDATRCVNYTNYGKESIITLGAYKLAVDPRTTWKNNETFIRVTRSDGKTEADVTYFPDLGKQTADLQFGNLVTEWFQDSEYNLLDEMKYYPKVKWGTVALQPYEQAVPAQNGNPARVVHGILLLIIDSAGHGLVFDVYADGRIPSDSPDWKRLDDYMGELLAGIYQ